MDFGFHSTAEDVTDGIDLTGKTYLVTGCNSGLGYETIRVLALRGASIVGLARTADKAQGALDTLGISGRAVACELSDLASVRAAVDELQGVSLDGIIANAGIMALPELEQKDGVELQFMTNHVGHFVLVTGLIEQLAEGARVVILSSGAHFLAKERGLELDNMSGEQEYEAWRMYGRSKLANVLFARELSNRFRKQQRDATAFSCHPGVIQTNLGRHVENKEAMYERFKNRLKTVGQGAATQCLVATRAESAHSGLYFADCQVADTLPIGADDAAAARLWSETEVLLQQLG